MFIDISYPYVDTMAIYPNNPEFSIRKVQDLEKGNSANVSLISMGSHTGTHIDAPSHFIADGATIDQIALESMNGCAKLFDLRGHNEITKELLIRYDIKEGDIVLLKTDNSSIFHNDTVLSDYTTLNYAAAEYLVEKRIKMVGIDYMTIEMPRRKRVSEKSVHAILLSNKVLIVEALDLTQAQEGDYQLYCFPIKLKGADGAPVRVVLWK